MTPEQLEAHRVRFEQAYAKNITLPIFLVAQHRNGNGYKHAQIQPCWQAYQWALADADHAQRAVPVIEAMAYDSLRSVLEDMLDEDDQDSRLAGYLDRFEALLPQDERDAIRRLPKKASKLTPIAETENEMSESTLRNLVRSHMRFNESFLIRDTFLRREYEIATNAMIYPVAKAIHKLISAQPVDAELATKWAKRAEESASYMASLNRWLPVIGALAELEKIDNARHCAGPRCMYIAGFEGSAHSKECLTQAGAEQGWIPTAEDLAEAGPSAELATTTAAAAQPVEVQRHAVSLSKDRQNRIYIAGPMTGYAEFNFPAFNAIADKLRAQGFHVENPAEHGIVDGAEWADYLHYDIGCLATCANLMLLPGWSKSKGAALEVSIARGLGMGINFAEGAEAQPVGVQRVPLTDAEIDRLRQLVNAVEDVSPGYMQPEDWQLSAKLTAACGLRVSNRVTEAAHGIKPTSSEGGA